MIAQRVHIWINNAKIIHNVLTIALLVRVRYDKKNLKPPARKHTKNIYKQTSIINNDTHLPRRTIHITEIHIVDKYLNLIKYKKIQSGLAHIFNSLYTVHWRRLGSRKQTRFINMVHRPWAPSSEQKRNPIIHIWYTVLGRRLVSKFENKCSWYTVRVRRLVNKHGTNHGYGQY